MDLRDLFASGLRLFLAMALFATPLALVVVDPEDHSRPLREQLKAALGFCSSVALTGTLVGAPLLLARRWIVQAKTPLTTRGYLLVAAYGPLLLLGMKFAIDGEWSAYLMMCVLYEVAAGLVTGIYVFLLRAGEAWQGKLSRPILIGAAVLAIASSPFGIEHLRHDDCMDRGDVWREGRCVG